jgi:hypothetical protein
MQFQYPEILAGVRGVVHGLILDSIYTELKRQYLACLAELATEATTLRHIVNRLLEQNISRKLLISWAVDAGYNEGYVRTLLSKLLCSTGNRQRQPGAGPKPPAEALLLLAIATDTFGESAEKFLRAAARAGKTATLAAIPKPDPGPDIAISVRDKAPSNDSTFSTTACSL